MSDRVLGVIGGMGPLATACFLERVAEMTEVSREQEHLDMIICNFPSIPDRTGYLLGHHSESPLPKMLGCARTLEALGVAAVAIPCMTAHVFHRELQEAVAIPVLNAISDTAALLNAAGISRVGILATDGTIRSGSLTRELQAQGITALIPPSWRQRDVMHLIYRNIKAGSPMDAGRFHAVCRELTEQGAQCLLLGCTELSLLRREIPMEENILDMMDVLAREAILRCGKPLKPQYQTLLKGVGCVADQHSGISGANCRPAAG